MTRRTRVLAVAGLLALACGIKAPPRPPLPAKPTAGAPSASNPDTEPPPGQTPEDSSPAPVR